MCGGLLLEVCVCRNQFSHQLRLQTLEVGGGQEFRHKFAFSISVMCVYQDVMWRQVMWIIAKEGILTGQKQACSKIARCWGVRSSQCKNGLKHNRMVFWWRPSNQSHDQTRPIPNYLHINKERGIVFPVSLLPSWHWVLCVTQDTLCVNQMSHSTLFKRIYGNGWKPSP